MLWTFWLGLAHSHSCSPLPPRLLLLWAGQPCPLQAVFVYVDFQNSLHDGQPLFMPLNIGKLPLSLCLSVPVTWWTPFQPLGLSVVLYSGQPFLLIPGRLFLPFFFFGCVILGKLLNLSVLQFPYLWNVDDNSIYLISLLGGLNEFIDKQTDRQGLPGRQSWSLIYFWIRACHRAGVHQMFDHWSKGVK